MQKLILIYKGKSWKILTSLTFRRQRRISLQNKNRMSRDQIINMKYKLDTDIGKLLLNNF